jgi:L-amino acid N-acyltransferase YncA
MSPGLIYQITFMEPEDWISVREIYREGIITGNATFETELPDWKNWDGNHRPDCRLLAKNGKQILGWAALRPVSARLVYCGLAEVSVYVAAAARANGVGKALLKALVGESECHGVWTLQAGIFPENVASVAIHKSCGFREVGIRYRMGKMGDAWRDVLLLERRSPQVAA